MQTKIRGYLKLIVFESKNGYYIAKFQLELDKKPLLTIKGFLSSLRTEQLYELTGNFVTNEKYGQNFEVSNITKIEPQNEKDVLKYLTSELFPTIGPKTAQILINYYQTDVLKKIKANFNQLLTIPGLKVEAANIIINTLKNMTLDEEINHQFQQDSLSLQVLSLLRRKFKLNEIKEILTTDPYEFLIIEKINFKLIDKIYLAFNQEIFSPVRIGYYAWYLAQEICDNSGDTYCELDQITILLQKTFHELSKDKILAGLVYIKSKNRLIFQNNRIYVDEIYHSEINIAYLLNSLNTTERYDQTRIDEAIETIAHQKQIAYNSQQIKAINDAIGSNFLVIIGGPGTGKTTVVDGIVTLIKKIYPQSKVALAAPTGKAVKRLCDKTKEKAFTIHKMLKYDPNTNNFLHNASNPLEYDVLILDEASMIDSVLLSQITKASLHLRKLILIGDPNQLPSISCGDVLRDIINANLFNVITLQDIYRQEEGNDILELSYAIEQDYFEYNLFNKKDLFFFEHSDSKTLMEEIGNTYQKIYQAAKEDYSKIQVIAPMYNGPVGITMLNNFLQEKINPKKGQKEQQVGLFKFRVHDKVMQLKNRPELEIYNGDVGIIVDIKKDKNQNIIIVVQYDHNIVQYSKELQYDITLAYACSVHKLQGSEYDNVLFVITKSFWMMLKRNLIYTAVTRAKNKLYFFGEHSAFLQGVKNVEQKRRTTLREIFDELI